MPDSAAMRQFTHRLIGYRSLSGLLPTVCFVTPTSSEGTQLAAHRPGGCGVLVVGRRGCLIGVARRGRATMFSGERRMFAGVDLRAPTGKVVAPVARGVGRIGRN